MIYSVARTESAFDQRDTSPAKAVGLMQVTPEAGRDTAKRFGVTYDWNKLVADPVYNTQMGAAELSALLREYRGSHIMTFAGYNAGRGRVQEWIKAHGDPRDPNVDAVDWVERIPFAETRNYVQRVMENLQVYRVRFGVTTSAISYLDLLREIEGAMTRSGPVGRGLRPAVSGRTARAKRRQTCCARQPDYVRRAKFRLLAHHDILLSHATTWSLSERSRHSASRDYRTGFMSTRPNFGANRSAVVGPGRSHCRMQCNLWCARTEQTAAVERLRDPRWLLSIEANDQPATHSASGTLVHCVENAMWLKSARQRASASSRASRFRPQLGDAGRRSNAELPQLPAAQFPAEPPTQLATA